MSKLSNKIFHDAKHRVSSPFGARSVISTSAGKTSSFHSGCDYSTYGEKLPQYAITNGTVLSCGIDTAYGGAKYVWVSYPSLGVKMLHYHLDDITVKSGQKVNENTVLGHTGQTGKATGIHLHLGLKRLEGGSYIDPEKWSAEVYEKSEASSKADKNASSGYKVGSYIVTAQVLNVRTGPSTKYDRKAFAKLSKSAQTKIKALTGKKVSGYVKGLTFDVSEVKGNWGKTPSGWVCLEYCRKI